MKKPITTVIVIIILIAVIFLIVKYGGVSNEIEVPAPFGVSTSTDAAFAATTTSSAQSPFVITEVEQVPVAPVLTFSNTTATFRLNETKTVGGVTITVKSIKDTRCAGSTQCVGNEGDARVLLGVAGPKTSKNVSLIEQQAFLIDDAKVTLESVLPERKRNQVIPEGDYQFVITVEAME